MNDKNQKIRKDVGLNPVRRLVKRCKESGDKGLASMAYAAEGAIVRFCEKRGLPQHGKPREATPQEALLRAALAELEFRRGIVGMKSDLLIAGGADLILSEYVIDTDEALAAVVKEAGT